MPRAGSDFRTPTEVHLAPHNGRMRVKCAKGPGVYGVHNAVEVGLFN